MIYFKNFIKKYKTISSHDIIFLSVMGLSVLKKDQRLMPYFSFLKTILGYNRRIYYKWSYWSLNWNCNWFFNIFKIPKHHIEIGNGSSFCFFRNDPLMIYSRTVVSNPFLIGMSFLLF